MTTMTRKEHLQQIRSFMELMAGMQTASPYAVGEELKIKNCIRISSALKKLGYMQNPNQNVWKWVLSGPITDADVEKVFEHAQQKGSEKAKNKAPSRPLSPTQNVFSFYRICQKHGAPFSQEFYDDIMDWAYVK